VVFENGNRKRTGWEDFERVVRGVVRARVGQAKVVTDVGSGGGGPAGVSFTVSLSCHSSVVAAQFDECV
jgi:hypothetical protein